jgi:hypothetical protein
MATKTPKTQANQKTRKLGLDDLSAAVAAIHAEAKAKGLDKLTMREINAEIEAYRREKDPLHGRTKRISISLSERMYREAKATAETIGWDLCMLVRQTIGDYLRHLQHPRAAQNNLFTASERRRIVKAISASTETSKTRRYKS